MDESPEMKRFHDNMLAVEQATVQAGVQNSVQWFKKKNLSEDVVSNLFNPIVRVSTDKNTGVADGKHPLHFDLRFHSVMVYGNQRYMTHQEMYIISTTQKVVMWMEETLSEGSKDPLYDAM